MNPLASPPLAASIMELNPGLTLWVAITFLVLIVVLAKVAWGPIVRMLDERERTIRDAIEQAKKERAEAEKLLAQQKESLAQARREAADLAKRNQQEVEGLRAELTAKARKEADDLVATARRTIEEETRKASAELKAQVADLAVGAATRIVKSSLDEKAQRALVEEYLRELPAGRN
jgi:F-type H+-transporting ATPase subunit b